MSDKKKRGGTNSIRMSLRIPVWMARRIDRVAEAEGLTFQAAANELLKRACGTENFLPQKVEAPI